MERGFLIGRFRDTAYTHSPLGIGKKSRSVCHAAFLYWSDIYVILDRPRLTNEGWVHIFYPYFLTTGK